MEIKIDTLRNVPILTVHSPSQAWNRVYGATWDKPKKRWIFPAYEPFLSKVLYDLPNVHPSVQLDALAQKWCDAYHSVDENRRRVEQITFPTKSYEHQLDGVAELLTNYRWGLRWGMGTGKTKVVIDTVSILRCKTLVLCPLVAVENWVKEVEVHSGGTLRAMAFTATSRQKKLDRLAELHKADIIVSTYDTAKIYGTPRMYPEALGLFTEQAPKTLSTAMKRLFSRVNNPEMQAELAADWLANRKMPRHIRDIVDEHTAGRTQWLKNIPYQYIVADESHRLSGRKSIRTEVCLELAKSAVRRTLLSGTMVGGEPSHLLPQLKFLAPYLMPEDWLKFKEKFYVHSPYNDKIVVGYKHLHILNSRVASVTSERHLDECVDLPERQLLTLRFELTKAQKRDYNYIVKNTPLVLPDDSELNIANGAVRNSKLFQICSGFYYIPENKDACDTCPYMRQCVSEGVKLGSAKCGTRATVDRATRTVARYPTNPKLDLLEERLKDLVQTEKAIVWAALTEEVQLISERLTKLKIGHVTVDGKTTKNIRKLEDRFNTDDKCRVYLAQIETGISVTLNIAKYMFYFSRDYSRDHRNQSMGRNYRIGQNKKTVVYDLCGARSLELQQLLALQRKDEISALLTNKVECTLCSHYTDCVEHGIQPWSKKCILETETKRVITKARTI